MRHTQFRIHAMQASSGMVSVAFSKVFYEGGKVAGHEIVLSDWCEPGQLDLIAGQFLSELAALAYRAGAELEPQLPL